MSQAGPHDPQVQESYDVVAVIGAIRSASSLAATTVLGPARIPLISFYSTSDDLSNKALYPYFLRVIPPNRSECVPTFYPFSPFSPRTLYSLLSYRQPAKAHVTHSITAQCTNMSFIFTSNKASSQFLDYGCSEYLLFYYIH